MKPTLYQYWISSSSWRVRWALAVKGIAFDTVVIDLRAGAQHDEAHRARNPMGYVPTLEIDGHALGESVAILEYLEETVPSPPLYPKAPLARARVRQVVELVNSGVQPMQNLAVQQRHSAAPDEQRAFAHHFNERGMIALERLLAQIADEGLGGRFCVGDELSAADLFLVPQVASARRFGVDLARTPRVLAVEAAALATPHAAAARPENQPGAPPMK